MGGLGDEGDHEEEEDGGDTRDVDEVSMRHVRPEDVFYEVAGGKEEVEGGPESTANIVLGTETESIR